jgi:hypothetical protein
MPHLVQCERSAHDDDLALHVAKAKLRSAIAKRRQLQLEIAFGGIRRATVGTVTVVCEVLFAEIDDEYVTASAVD